MAHIMPTIHVFLCSGVPFNIVPYGIQGHVLSGSRLHTGALKFH